MYHDNSATTFVHSNRCLLGSALNPLWVTLKLYITFTNDYCMYKKRRPDFSDLLITINFYIIIYTIFTLQLCTVFSTQFLNQKIIIIYIFILLFRFFPKIKVIINMFYPQKFNRHYNHPASSLQTLLCNLFLR